MTVAITLPQTYLTGSGTATASTTQTQAAGTVPTAAYVECTVANASDAITLPRGCAGQMVVFKGGANAAKLFPPVGGAINGGTVDAAYTLAASVNTLLLYTSEVNAVAIKTA